MKEIKNLFLFLCLFVMVTSCTTIQPSKSYIQLNLNFMEDLQLIPKPAQKEYHRLSKEFNIEAGYYFKTKEESYVIVTIREEGLSYLNKYRPTFCPFIPPSMKINKKKKDWVTRTINNFTFFVGGNFNFSGLKINWKKYSEVIPYKENTTYVYLGRKEALVLKCDREYALKQKEKYGQYAYVVGIFLFTSSNNRIQALNIETNQKFLVRSCPPKNYNPKENCYWRTYFSHKKKKTFWKKENFFQPCRLNLCTGEIK